MQTIRYSRSFDCLILEREGGRLSYIQKDDRMEKLFQTLKYYETLDGPEPELEARVPQATAEFLYEKWKKEGGLIKERGKINLKEIGL